MPLADFDVKQQLHHQFTYFFSKYHFTFPNLKILLLNKLPISEVHDQLAAILNECSAAAHNEAEQSLKEAAYNQQVSEDELEARQDPINASADSIAYNNLNQELQTKSVQKESLMLQLSTMDHLFMSPGYPTVQVTHHNAPPPLATTYFPPSNIHTHYDSPLARIELQQQIDTINRRIDTINRDLRAIESRTRDRESRRSLRESRLQARIDYTQHRVSIAATLSVNNWTTLSTNIARQIQTLNEQHIALAKEAKQLNYSIFLDMLEIHLNSSTLLTQEIDALRTIIRLMRHHLRHEKETVINQYALDAAIQSIVHDKYNLEGLHEKVTVLTQANPTLTAANQKLSSLNLELTHSRNHNNALRYRLFLTTLTLLGISLAITLPLILTLSGVISIALTPLLLTVLILPPALLFVVALCVAIAAIVYVLKSSSNNTSIQKNDQTMHLNIDQMAQNLQELQNLQSNTIPQLQTQILNKKSAKTELITALETSQRVTDQTLQQAQSVEPSVYNPTLSFLGVKNVYQHPSVMQNNESPPQNGPKPSAPPVDSTGATPSGP